MEDLLMRLGISPGLIDVLHLGLLGRLLLAAILGGLIGLERELRAKPAGLRTNLLICMGAALLMEISIGVATRGFGAAELPPGAFRGDPGRIAAQIVSGIGFLGAGTILHARGSVTGLTTAATIWVVAAIGMAVGARAYVEAIGSAVLVGFSLVLLARVEDLLIKRKSAQRYFLSLDGAPELMTVVETTFRERGLRVETETIDKQGEVYEMVVEVTGPIRMHGPALRELAAQPGVRRLSRDP